MTREFIELPEFLKRWYQIGLNDEDLGELEVYLCKYPEKGDLIRGTGGLRKIRWKCRGRGKSGGIRTLYVDFAYYEKIYLITVYTKSEKANISTEEKHEIKKLIDALEHQLERKWGK
jgi:hypothetical protein